MYFWFFDMNANILWWKKPWKMMKLFYWNFKYNLHDLA